MGNPWALWMAAVPFPRAELPPISGGHARRHSPTWRSWQPATTSNAGPPQVTHISIECTSCSISKQNKCVQCSRIWCLRNAGKGHSPLCGNSDLQPTLLMGYWNGQADKSAADQNGMQTTAAIDPCRRSQALRSFQSVKQSPRKRKYIDRKLLKTLVSESFS
jgi:hypothetical protein